MNVIETVTRITDKHMADIAEAIASVTRPDARVEVLSIIRNHLYVAASEGMDAGVNDISQVMPLTPAEEAEEACNRG